MYMKKFIIVIPSHLHAKRLPYKPLLLIGQDPMIIHVWRQAQKSKIRDIWIATPDQKIIDAIQGAGGNAIITKKNHTNGSDRIFEAIENLAFKPDVVINLQGDMPLINEKSINALVEHMQTNNTEIATLASKLNEEDFKNPNVVKVETELPLVHKNFEVAKNFLRKTINKTTNIYHHVGIYAYEYEILKKYVHLQKTQNELERSLEQMRALDNNINIKVGFISDHPLGVDTPEDLEKIRTLYNEK